MKVTGLSGITHTTVLKAFLAEDAPPHLLRSCNASMGIDMAWSWTTEEAVEREAFCCKQGRFAVRVTHIKSYDDGQVLKRTRWVFQCDDHWGEKYAAVFNREGSNV